jgi:hypothetical protein
VTVDQALIVYQTYVRFIGGEVNLPPSVADRVEAAQVLNRILDLAEKGTSVRMRRPRFPHPTSPIEAAYEASQICERFEAIRLAAQLEGLLPDAFPADIKITKV